MKEYRQGNVLIAAVFIAATAIGVSYFSIPILTGIAGFFPALLMSILVWGFNLAISLLYTEAILGQPDGANLPSISRALMGKVWMVILSLVFFINMITYMTTYAIFMAQSLQWFFENAFHLHPSLFLCGLLSTVPFFFIIFLGVRASCNVNSILMIGLFVSFFLMIYLGSESVLKRRLFESHWIYIFFAVPILFSAFQFMGIMPPLCTYLNRDPKKIRLSILLGTCITLIIYLFWQWFMIGSISSGTFWVNFEEGVDMEKIFSLVERFPHITYLFNFTLFFSMITSLLGNGTATVEFLCDGFKIPLEQRRGWKRLAPCLFVFLLVLPFSLIKGQWFLHLLQSFTAPIGEVMINGIIPVWMVAQARYNYLFTAPKMLPGGRSSLFVLGVAIFILIYLEGIVFIRS